MLVVLASCWEIPNKQSQLTTPFSVSKWSAHTLRGRAQITASPTHCRWLVGTLFILSTICLCVWSWSLGSLQRQVFVDGLLMRWAASRSWGKIRWMSYSSTVSWCFGPASPIQPLRWISFYATYVHCPDKGCLTEGLSKMKHSFMYRQLVCRESFFWSFVLERSHVYLAI